MADGLLVLAVLVIAGLLAALCRVHREVRELRRIIAASRDQRKRRFLP